MQSTACIKEGIKLNLQSDEQGSLGAGGSSSVAVPPDGGVGALRPPTPPSLHPIKMDEARVTLPPVLVEKEGIDLDEERIAKDRLRWKNLQVSERDRRLLILLLHQKFMTLDQIHGSCYEGLSLQMPRMRLRKLMHFGMIKARRVYTEARQIYLLAKAGYGCLEGLGKSLDLGFLPEIDLRVFEHDKAVTELRLALESTGVRPWKSERELRKERPGARVPDAMFRMNGRTIALEFENADKGLERYRAIFLSHLDRPVADRVLYVLRAQEKLRSLPPILRGLQDRRLGLDLGRISFALEKDVIERRLEAVAGNVKRGELRLADI